MRYNSLVRQDLIHNNHTTGAWAEMVAATHFISLGFLVSWPAISQAPYDFILDTGSLDRVHVKKAFWNRNSGSNEYLQVRLGKSRGTSKGQPYQDEDFDRFIAVDDAGRIWDIPWPEFNRPCIHLDKRGDNFKHTVRDYNPEEWRIL